MHERFFVKKFQGEKNHSGDIDSNGEMYLTEIAREILIFVVQERV
jgi:hypothetical protein